MGRQCGKGCAKKGKVCPKGRKTRYFSIRRKRHRYCDDRPCKGQKAPSMRASYIDNPGIPFWQSQYKLKIMPPRSKKKKKKTTKKKTTKKKKTKKKTTKRKGKKGWLARQSAATRKYILDDNIPPVPPLLPPTKKAIKQEGKGLSKKTLRNLTIGLSTAGGVLGPTALAAAMMARRANNRKYAHIPRML